MNTASGQTGGRAICQGIIIYWIQIIKLLKSIIAIMSGFGARFMTKNG